MSPDGYTDREKARCLMAGSDSRPLTTPIKMFYRYFKRNFSTIIFKNKEHYINCVEYYKKNFNNINKASELPKENFEIFEGIRYLNQIELERCHNIPNGYTSILTRNETVNLIRDGWEINTIKNFFKNLPYKEENNK